MKRYAVIPTRDRAEEYGRAVEAIRTQVDDLITIAHLGATYAMGEVIRYDDDPPSISRMWNLGLDRAAELAGDEDHWVALLNDDAVVADGWFDTILAACRKNSHVLGSGPRRRVPRKIAGYAFIVNGRTIRADEALRWWYSDDHFQREAEMYWGGMSIVPEAKVKHVREGDVDPRMSEQIVRDRIHWDMG